MACTDAGEVACVRIRTRHRVAGPGATWNPCTLINPEPLREHGIMWLHITACAAPCAEWSNGRPSVHGIVAVPVFKPSDCGCYRPWRWNRHDRTFWSGFFISEPESVTEQSQPRDSAWSSQGCVWLPHDDSW